MPVFLRESQIGTATDIVGFPHLVVCLGFVAVTANAMFGMHADTREDSSVLAHDLLAFMVQKGATGADIVAVYGSCNRAQRYTQGNREHAWKVEMREVAAVFGFHGPARGFDTGIISPADGTYVEYRPNYLNQTCRIFYKRNEKMSFTATSHSPALGFNANIKQQSPMMVMDVYAETTGAQVVPTFANSGQLHEVNYATRLVSFTI